MNKITITVNDQEYIVDLAITDEEKEKGLQGVKKLPKNSGMLFVYEEPDTVDFWMKDCLIPLDLIFIDEYGDIVKVITAEPDSEEIYSVDNILYVLELNQGSSVKKGDEVDLSELEDEDIEFEEEDLDNDVVMLVLNPKGKTQMQLDGGERIFSRKNTKTLIRLAKKAYKSKQDRDYRQLGRKVFQYIKTQDESDPQYVDM